MLRLYSARAALGVLLLLALGGNANADVLKPWTILAPDRRFVVLDSFSGNAVLDRSTNLIWETDANGSSSGASWADAQSACHSRLLSEHFGWRLPKVEELLTLLSPLHGVHAPNPFTDVTTATNAFYWSASEVPTDNGDVSTSAYGVPFGIPGAVPHPKTNLGKIWCVRGGVN